MSLSHYHRHQDEASCPPSSITCGSNDPNTSTSTTNASYPIHVRHWPRAQIVAGIVSIVVLILLAAGGTLAIVKGWTNGKCCKRKRGYKTRFEGGANVGPAVSLPGQPEAVDSSQSERTFVSTPGTHRGSVVSGSEHGGISQETSETRLVPDNHDLEKAEGTSTKQ